MKLRWIRFDFVISSYIWVWKSEAVVYSLILLVTLGPTWDDVWVVEPADVLVVAWSATRMERTPSPRNIELAGIADVLKDCKRGFQRRMAAA